MASFAIIRDRNADDKLLEISAVEVDSADIDDDLSLVDLLL